MRAAAIPGDRFGRFTLIACVGKSPRGAAVWEMRCDCGTMRTQRVDNVRNGHVKSCGCLKQEMNDARTAASSTHHKGTSTPEYAAWAAARRRSFDPGIKDVAHYSGRGITMHPLFVESFDAFLTEVGRRPSMEHTLDRIDNDKGYEPGNIRWATRSEQNANRRSKKKIEEDRRKFGKIQRRTKSNSPLYAAAPDLYEALAWLETYAEVQVRNHPEATDTPNWRKILIALAKARGLASVVTALNNAEVERRLAGGA